MPAELDALAEVYRVVRRAGGDEDDVIMLGDFNADDAHLGRLGQIPGITPLIRGVFTNTRQNELYDNIIIHQPSTTEYAGRSGVFDVMRQFNITLARPSRSPTTSPCGRNSAPTSATTPAASPAARGHA